MEQSNLSLLILIGYTATILIALIMCIYLIYEWFVKPKILIGELCGNRQVCIGDKSYDCVLHEGFNTESLPVINSYVKGYIQRYYQDEPRDVFVILEMSEEPFIVD